MPAGVYVSLFLTPTLSSRQPFASLRISSNSSAYIKRSKDGKQHPFGLFLLPLFWETRRGYQWDEPRRRRKKKKQVVEIGREVSNDSQGSEDALLHLSPLYIHSHLLGRPLHSRLTTLIPCWWYMVGFHILACVFTEMGLLFRWGSAKESECLMVILLKQ